MVGILGPILSTLILITTSMNGGAEEEVYAVLPFKTVGIDRRLQTIITNTVRGTLVKNNCNVIRPDIQQQLLEMQGLSNIQCTETICGVKVGQALKADFVVVGGILLRGEEVYIYASLVDVARKTEKNFAQSILPYTENAMPYSKRAEGIGYLLLDKPSPGWSKKELGVLAGMVIGGGAYGYYEFTRTKTGDVIIIATFPIGGE